MNRITSLEGLRESIEILEKRQANDEEEIRKHFQLIHDGIKPFKIVKNLFSGAARSINISDMAFNNLFGPTAGIISKFVFDSFVKSPLKRLIGKATIIGFNSLIARNPELIKAMGKAVIDIFRDKTDNDTDEAENTPADENES